MHKVLALFLAGASMAGGAVPLIAQEAGSRQTREFVQAAGQSDTFEMLEANSALAQSRDPQIRAFAQRMIEDHSQSTRALTEATSRSGLQPPPMTISNDQAQLLGALQSARGPEFDKDYMRHQALAHRAALAVDEAYAAHGDDPAVRQTATSAVSLVMGHIAMADQMRAKLGGS